MVQTLLMDIFLSVWRFDMMFMSFEIAGLEVILGKNHRYTLFVT